MKSYFSEDLIKKAIAKKIYECVSTKDKPAIIFADKIEEGAVEPFFLILVIDVSQRNAIRNNFWRLYQMKVLYYTDELNPNRITDLRKMGERLFGILDTIDVEYKQEDGKSFTRPLKCRKLNYQITENVLNFFCTYKVKVYQEQESSDKMQILQIIE